MNSRRILLPILILFLGTFSYLTKNTLAEEPSGNPGKALSAEEVSTLKGIGLEWQLVNSIEVINKSGVAVGGKFNQFKGEQDVEELLKASENDFAVAAAALLKAKAIVAEMDDPQKKTDWGSIIQDFENWLVALERFSLAMKYHDQGSRVAAVKEARTAYEAGWNSLQLRIAAETRKQSVSGRKPTTQ
jgi:hypothetical protein